MDCHKQRHVFSLGSSFSSQKTIAHPIPGRLHPHRLPQARSPFRSRLAALRLFFIHAITVLREIPHVRSSPRKLLRSSYALIIPFLATIARWWGREAKNVVAGGVVGWQMGRCGCQGRGADTPTRATTRVPTLPHTTPAPTNVSRQYRSIRIHGYTPRISVASATRATASR